MLHVVINNPSFVFPIHILAPEIIVASTAAQQIEAQPANAMEGMAEESDKYGQSSDSEYAPVSKVSPSGNVENVEGDRDSIEM